MADEGDPLQQLAAGSPMTPRVMPRVMPRVTLRR